MICFTICSRNFLSQAYVLYRSLTRFHPQANFCVALCDEVGTLDLLSFPFRIITLEQLNIRHLAEMRNRYNITELNTAIKPFVFDLLHVEWPGEAIVYFDPDILVTSRLEELEAEISAGADCILIPHMTEPCEWAELNEGRLLQYGIYNLGFLMLRSTPEVQRINRWWGRRLETHCLIDRERGLFVDQKWADLLPSFIPATHILRHPGYNVAYWNLATRTVREDADGTWHVNGKPLRFFHFSGSSLSDTPIFSRHSSEFVRGGLRDLDRLFDSYVAEVGAAGFAHYRATYPYAFNWGGASGQNEHTPETMTSQASVGYSGTVLDAMRPHIPLLSARSQIDFFEKEAHIKLIERKRRLVEEQQVPKSTDSFALEGYCVVCGRTCEFTVSAMNAAPVDLEGPPIPKWNEQLVCPGCGLDSRSRSALHTLFQESPPCPSARVYLTEQATPLHRWFEERFEGVVGSQFMGEGISGGATLNGCRHENIKALSFEDDTFDLVVSLEPLDHMAFLEHSLHEFRRVLRERGVLIFPAPFRSDQEVDEVEAKLLCDGDPYRLVAPEPDGLPADLVGDTLRNPRPVWDVTVKLREAGFSDVAIHSCWSRRLGYLGPKNAIIIARA